MPSRAKIITNQLIRMTADKMFTKKDNINICFCIKSSKLLPNNRKDSFSNQQSLSRLYKNGKLTSQCSNRLGVEVNIK